MYRLRKIDDTIQKVEKTLIALIFVLLILLLFFNIVSRNFFHKSYNFILELAPLLVVWLSFLGASLALKQNRHIKLDILFRYISPKTQYALRSFCAVVGIVIMGVLALSSFVFVYSEIEMFGDKGWGAIIFILFFIISSFRFLLIGLQSIINYRSM